MLVYFRADDTAITDRLTAAGYTWSVGEWHGTMQGPCVPGPGIPDSKSTRERKTLLLPQLELTSSQAAAMDLVIDGHTLITRVSARYAAGIGSDWGSRRFG